MWSQYPLITSNGEKTNLSTYFDQNKTNILISEYIPILIYASTQNDSFDVEKSIWVKVTNSTQTPIVVVEETHSSKSTIRLFAAVSTNHTVTDVKWVLTGPDNTPIETNFRKSEIQLNKTDIRARSIKRIFWYVQSVNSNGQKFAGEGFYETQDFTPKMISTDKSLQLKVTVHRQSTDW